MWELVFAVIGAVLGSCATFVAAMMKRRDERQSDWWNRFEWAVDAVSSDNEERRTMGNLVMLNLATDPQARDHDLELVKSWLREYASREAANVDSEGVDHELPEAKARSLA